MNKICTLQAYQVTLTFGQFHHLSYHLEGHPIDYLLTKVNSITVKSARDIQSQKQQKKVPITTFKGNLLTFTFSQGYPKAHHFKTLCKCYLLAKFQYSNMNSVRDIVKNFEKCPFFHFKADPATLTLRQCHSMAHHSTYLFTNYLWAKLHSSTVNSFRDNGPRLSLWWMNSQVDRRTDAWTLAGHFIYSNCLHFWIKNTQS